MADKKTTALYLRVSTNSQFEEGYSIEEQEKKLRAYCDSRDYNNISVYTDGGWSGSNLERPQIKKLISDILNHKVQRVLVYKLDRISRSQKDTLFLLEEVFRPNDIDFISLSENFDTGSPYGKAMIGILSVFAQLERENIRERTRMGMYGRVKSGKYPGGNAIPFGYDYDANKGELIPNDDADKVREIYDLYLQGYSTTQLARIYSLCSDRHVTNILDRVTYIGKILYNNEIIDGIHEPLIDEETWNKVQAERKRRSTKNLQHSNYLLSGFLECGKCGAKMRYQKWGKTGLKIYCYSQQTSKMNLVKDPNCDNARVDAEEVEKLVLEDVFNITDKITANETLSDANKERVRALDAIQKQYEKLSAKIKKLYNLYAESDDELLLESIKENKEELENVKKTLDNERASVAAVTSIVEDRNKVKNLRNKWDSLTIHEKRRALAICVEKIVITDNKITPFYML